jgi:5'-nucleotidase (lipoprotein e(P4) family)
MDKRIIISGIIVSSVLSGCRQGAQTNTQEHLLQSVTWYQQSAEMKAIYIQSYNWASRVLKEKAEQVQGKPIAVILDIDETMLDNSPQTARQIVDGVPFSDEIWDEWCLLSKAEPLPGALDFTSEAADMGVELFYISNRDIHLLDVTIKNLESCGFPYADGEHVLLKTDRPSKDDRRSKVRQTHDVVLLIGDNLGDFSGIFENRKDGADLENVMANRALFGYDYILLPNPLYGDWEKQFRGESAEVTNRNKKDALRVYNR